MACSGSSFISATTASTLACSRCVMYPALAASRSSLSFSNALFSWSSFLSRWLTTFAMRFSKDRMIFNFLFSIRFNLLSAVSPASRSFIISSALAYDASVSHRSPAAELRYLSASRSALITASSRVCF